MDDARIIQLYWDRDEQAIAATAARYGGYCSAIAMNILANREDAEECVSETYMNAWNAMPPQRPSVLSAFLGRIVRNLAFSRYRYNRAGKRGGGEIPAVLEELSELVSGRENVEQAAAGRALTGAIGAFLDTLPARKRNIFVRRYWYTDSMEAIARRYGVTPAAAAMMLRRMREALRRYLEKEGYEP